MFKETIIRVGITIIIAVIVNLILKKTSEDEDSDTKILISKWGRVITNVGTAITILVFIFPSLSTSFFFMIIPKNLVTNRHNLRL